MITLQEYFNNKTAAVTPEISLNAVDLLKRVNDLLAEFTLATGKHIPVSLKTGCNISGDHNGDGGFRLQNSKTGSPFSSHKSGQGVDVADTAAGDIDAFVTDEILERHDLYRESPGFTHGWCHLSTRKPGSGHRTFTP